MNISVLPAQTPETITTPRLGVYFGLDETAYHADEALGSHAMNALAVSPPDFWFNSAMNPLLAPEEPSLAKIRGSATHKRVLEGKDAFELSYGPTDYPGNIKAGIEERRAIREAARTPISRADWNRIEMTGAVIEANPALQRAFIGSCGNEVSIFWETNGLRKKARIDSLKVKANVDLKTHAKTKNIPFQRSCTLAVANYNMPVQAEHYREGRMSIVDHLKAGRVYGNHDEALLARVADSVEFAWIWIFVQSTGAPLTFGLMLSHGNGLYDIARNVISRAEDNYRRCMTDFGRDTPWLLVEHLAELHVEDMPAYYGRD